MTARRPGQEPLARNLPLALTPSAGAITLTPRTGSRATSDRWGRAGLGAACIFLGVALPTAGCVAPPGAAGPASRLDEAEGSSARGVCKAMVAEIAPTEGLDAEALAAYEAEVEAALERCTKSVEEAVSAATRQEMPTLTCLAQAADSAAIEACQRPDPTAVCEHVLHLVLTELSAQMGEEERAQMESVIEEGKKQCVAQAQSELAMDPEGYARTAKCFLGAQSVPELQACEMAAGPPPMADDMPPFPPDGFDEMDGIEPPPEPFPDAEAQLPPRPERIEVEPPEPPAEPAPAAEPAPPAEP